MRENQKYGDPSAGNTKTLRFDNLDIQDTFIIKAS